MSNNFDFDLIVIGGGAAGLTASGIGASLGAKTLMIEREKLGGDCTWKGCVPSKTLLKAAKVAHHIRHASQFGLVDQEFEVDFAKVMEHVRSTREEVYEDADAPSIYEEMGIDVRFGKARFTGTHSVEIESEEGTTRLRGRYFVVAAGGRAAPPPIDGLDEVDYLTNESVFEITERPDHLAVIGAGPIGTEMAQAMRRLGARVTVIERGDRILKKDDAQLAEMLQEVLEEEGVEYVFGADVRKVSQNGKVEVAVKQGDRRRTVEADALLVATGRKPNVENLNLEAAGVEYTKKGITVDDRCRTSQPHIFAVGDVTGRYQFTHMSEHMAKVAATNAILKLPSKIDTEHVPWVTYTEPELAHVGATEEQLKERGEGYQVYRFPFSKIDRAITESETTGMIKVYAKKWTGKILGASILGVGAGDLICEFAVAMKGGVTLREIADTIHPYPTLGLGVRRAADQWYAQKQSARVTRFVQKVFGYHGEVHEPDPDRIV